MVRWFHNVVLVSLSKTKKPNNKRDNNSVMFASEQLLIHQVKHSNILCFLDPFTFLLHKFTTSSKICHCIVVRSGWQHVSRTELDSSSCELPAASQLA